MKLWIVYDTQFGNGKKLANVLKDEAPTDWEVMTGDVKEISPEKIVTSQPDGIIVGGAIRMFQGAPKSKKWIKGLEAELEKSNTSIKAGTTFLTHGLPTNRVQGYSKRFLKKINKAMSIDNTYPVGLTARVKGQEGPILPEEFEKSKHYMKDFVAWMQTF